jgi:hypothetical protein
LNRHKNWLDHRRLAEAFAFAAGAHREQLRKDTRISHISHLMSVCALVLEHGGDEDQALVRYSTTPSKVASPNRFGERWAAI